MPSSPPTFPDRRPTSRLARRFVSASALATIVLATAPVRAAHPLTTEDAGTLGAGTVEIEVGATGGSEWTGSPTAAGGSLGLKVGLHEIVDLGVAVSYGATESDPRWRIDSVAGPALQATPWLAVSLGAGAATSSEAPPGWFATAAATVTL